MIDAEYVGTRRREQMAARKLEDAARAMHVRRTSFQGWIRPALTVLRALPSFALLPITRPKRR